MADEEDTGLDAASREVVTTHLESVAKVDKFATNDVNEVARYLFASGITYVSARILILLNQANDDNVGGLVNALLQRKYIKASSKEGFYDVVKQGIAPRREKNSRQTTGGEEMSSKPNMVTMDEDDLEKYVLANWHHIAWSLIRKDIAIYGRFAGTLFVGKDFYPDPVSASRALKILIDNNIVFSYGDNNFRFTEVAKKMIQERKTGAPNVAAKPAVPRSPVAVLDKHHLKMLRRDLREIVIALNVFELRRDDENLARVIAQLVRDHVIATITTVDLVFLACADLVISSDFVFKKGDGFGVNAADEVLRARMNIGKQVAPVHVPAPPVPAKATTSVVAAAPVPVPTTLVPQNIVPAVSVPVVPVAAPVATPSPSPVVVADVVSEPEPVLAASDAAAVLDVPVTPAEAASTAAEPTFSTLVLDDSPISFLDAKVIAVPIVSAWVSYVKKQYDSTTWTRVHLVIGLTKALQYMTPDLIKILVDEFGFSHESAYQVIYECNTLKGLATSRRIRTMGGKLVTWQKSAMDNYNPFLRQLIGGFAASLLQGFSDTPQPELDPVPDVAATSAEPVLVADQSTTFDSTVTPADAAVETVAVVIYAEGVQPIDIEFLQFTLANYDHTVWSHHDFFYVLTRGQKFESLDLVNVVSKFTNHSRHWVSERIFTSTTRGFSKADRHSQDRRDGKTISWCDRRITKSTKELLQQVESHYAQHCKNVKKAEAAPVASESSVLPPAAVNADLVLSMAEVKRLTAELEKASAEAERLNGLLDEATRFFVAEQTAHRATAKQLRDEKAAHEATDAALTESQRSHRVTTEQFKLEQAAHQVTLSQIEELIVALSIAQTVVQKFLSMKKK